MRSFTKIGIGAFAGLMLAALAGTARADVSGYEGTTPSGDEAATWQAKADAARTKAAGLAKQGGWAYKTGAVDRAARDAARFQAEADAARGVTTSAPAPYVSPELADAQARLQELRQSGGWAYKSGAVARAEADVRALSGPRETVMSQNEAVQRPIYWGKPVEKTMRTYR
jgi:hypothetical protein